MNGNLRKAVFAGAGLTAAIGLSQLSSEVRLDHLPVEAAPFPADAADVWAADGHIAVSATPEVASRRALFDGGGAVAVQGAVRILPPNATPETVDPHTYIPHYDIWLRLAHCESTDDWQINTHNGFYGGLQYLQETWIEFGGQYYADRADHATPEQQMLIAEKVLSKQGWKAWPACSAILGLR